MADSRHITRRTALSTISMAPLVAALPAAALETEGLVGLPLAAVHIDRAIEAMGEPGLAGVWQVTIHSGDPEQNWFFHHIPASPRARNDPLITAIKNFRDGLAEFNALPSGMMDNTDAEQQAIEATYGPPQQTLMNWDKPAKSLAGAIEALRLARDEAAEFSYSAISDNMVEAALAYLEGGGMQ